MTPTQQAIRSRIAKIEKDKKTVNPTMDIAARLTLRKEILEDLLAVLDTLNTKGER